MQSIPEQPKRKYELEDVLELMGGYDYFSHDQIMYVYLKINGHTEEAKFHFDNCMRDVEAFNHKKNRMRSEEEIKKLEEKIKDDVIEKEG